MSVTLHRRARGQAHPVGTTFLNLKKLQQGGGGDGHGVLYLGRIKRYLGVNSGRRYEVVYRAPYLSEDVKDEIPPEELTDDELTALIQANGTGNARVKGQRYSLGTQISVAFPGYGIFQGTLMSYDTKRKLYGVCYMDGDHCEMTNAEVKNKNLGGETKVKAKKKKGKRALLGAAAAAAARDGSDLVSGKGGALLGLSSSLGAPLAREVSAACAASGASGASGAAPGDKHTCPGCGCYGIVALASVTQYLYTNANLCCGHAGHGAPSRLFAKLRGGGGLLKYCNICLRGLNQPGGIDGKCTKRMTCRPASPVPRKTCCSWPRERRGKWWRR